jgi:DNA-binding response OmpR family regulator
MSHRILLIENDAAVAKVILDALTHSSDEFFEIEWVRHCSEGLAKLDGIVAIVVDLGLPNNRGLDTFDRLFHAAPRIPILVLIDPQDEETGKLTVQRGAQDYVFRTHLDNHLLLKALRSMIERAACSEALFEEKERACVTLNSIGDAVVSTDVSCQITYLNATAEELTGWTQEAKVTASDGALVDRDDKPSRSVYLVGPLRTTLRAVAAPRRLRPAWALWERWISEIVADFWSVARIGIGSTWLALAYQPEKKIAPTNSTAIAPFS